MKSIQIDAVAAWLHLYGMNSSGIKLMQIIWLLKVPMDLID